MAVFDNLILQIKSTSDRAAFAALRRLEGGMKRRIHQRGESTGGPLLRTRSPRQIGRYSVGHGRRRLKANRPVNIKDLEFKGDFRKAYGVGTSGPNFAFGFFTDKARLIAQGQQDQTNQEIFFPSDEEYNRMFKIFNQELNKI